MKILKHTICIILILSICLTTCVLSLSASVFKPTNIDSALIASLRSIEPTKEYLGLGYIDFTKLEISTPIHTYIFSDDGILTESYNYYPLLLDDTLVALAIKLDTIRYQITTNLVSEINSTISNITPFALIYNNSICYLYNNNTLCSLSKSNIENPQLLDSLKASQPNLLLTTMNITTPINYPSSTYTTTPRALIYSCNVSYVQQTMSSTCWAASIACIVNYKTGTNYTDVDIAQAYWGNYDYNKGVQTNLLDDILNQYGLSYEVQGGIPGANIITDNLGRDYPLLASFNVPAAGANHACVIYLYHLMSSYMYILDPMYGPQHVPAYESGQTYQYVSAYSGYLHVLQSYCYHVVPV